MKKLAKRIGIALIALLAALADAQTPSTIPITGNLGSITGSATPDAYVLIKLINCAGGNPVVSGWQGIVQTSAQYAADTNGIVNGTIWPNNLITCSGTTGTSMYSRTIVSNDVPVGQTQCYQIVSTQGTWNLNTQQPVTCGTTPPNPQDATYNNLVVTGSFSAGTITGTINGHANLDMLAAGGNFTGAISAPSIAGVVVADNYTGADCGAKINAADAAYSGQTVTIQFSQACGTAAWSAVTLSNGHNLKCAQPGTYNVNPITLGGSNTVDLGGNFPSCKLQPATTSVPQIFTILGASQSSNVGFITIRGGFLYANGNTATLHSAININFANNIHIENVTIDGGWDRDIFVNNVTYLYLDTVRAWGAATNDLLVENTGTSPYFGGPVYIRNSQFDSCACSDAAINLQDIASPEITDSEAIGVSVGRALVVTSSNGSGAAHPDYAAGLHVKGFTADTDVKEGIYLSGIIKSTIESSWLSTGRGVNNAFCLNLQGATQDITFLGVHAYWCGNYAMNIGGTATGIKVSGSTFAGNPAGGIHVVSASNSSFLGNSCNSTQYNGAGVTQPFCIYEESASANNIYIANDGTGTTYGNSYNGTNPFTLSTSGTQPTSCSIGQTWTNPSAASTSTVLYLCYPANTWTAVTPGGSSMAGTPTYVADAGAGTGPTVSILSGSTDGAGWVSITPGTTPSASAGVVTIVFGGTYGVAPRCAVAPAGTNSAALSGTGALYVPQGSSTTTNFVVNVGSTALTAGTAYVLRWGCSL